MLTLLTSLYILLTSLYSQAVIEILSWFPLPKYKIVLSEQLEDLIIKSYQLKKSLQSIKIAIIKD